MSEQEKTIDFINELDKLKEPVWQVIQKYLPNKFPEGHYDLVREYPLRQGKYLRPGLVLLTHQLYGGQNNQAALLTAAAMQLSEDWLLIHDDFEDHSEERRSTKTEKKLTLSKMSTDELAVNAGDAVHIIMWQVLGDNLKILGLERGLKIHQLFCQFLLTTTEGQFLELNWVFKNNFELKESDYFEVIKRKTAYYTIICPLQLGAIVAGVTDDELTRIEPWAEPFGYAFQLQDDFMNLTAATKVQGKEWGGDILEGKRTLMLIHLLDHCSAAEKDFIIKSYLKPRLEKTMAEVEQIVELMNKYKILDYVKNRAKQYAAQAKAKFEVFAQNCTNQEVVEIIKAAIDFVANRVR